MAIFKSEDAAYTKCEIFELKKLLCLAFIAGKTMKYTAVELFFIFFQHCYHFVLCLATMNHQWKIMFNTPTNLSLECLQLLVFKLSTPIIVKPNFSNGNKLLVLW